MKSRSVLLYFLLIVQLSACAQPNKRQFVKEIGWSVTLPPDFKVLSAADDAAINAKGKAFLEKEAKQEINVSTTRTLLSAKKDAMHYLNCVVNPFDVKKDGNWNEANAAVKSLLYDSFKNQMKGVEVDSSSVMVKIDGLTFDRFKIKLKIRDIYLTSYLYSRLYKGYDLGITCMFVDEKVGKQFQEMIDGSKFDRK